MVISQAPCVYHILPKKEPLPLGVSFFTQETPNANFALGV